MNQVIGSFNPEKEGLFDSDVFSGQGCDYSPTNGAATGELTSAIEIAYSSVEELRNG